MGSCYSKPPSRYSATQDTSAATSLFVYNDLPSKSIFNVIGQLFRHIDSRKLAKQKIEFSNIFRATDHNHRASAFREKCHNTSNTLVIAVTTQGRIYGGFTPCTWLNNLYYHHEQDIGQSSFLFAVEHDTIRFYNIIPSQTHKAIVNHAESGPIFGEGHDLYISDEADKYDSWCNLGKTYKSQYVYGTNKANMELSGQLRHRLKNYQVWEMVK